MFGTLVVVLPSKCRGGELVVRHAGRERTLDLGGDEPSTLRYAAFYADCEHEIRPVTRGHRVALVYNLISHGKKRQRPPPARGPAVERVARVLADWREAPEGPMKLIHLLEHQYTRAGLSPAVLKNGDAAVVDVLTRAAELSACDGALGILKLEESGSAEITEYHGRDRSYGWRRDRRPPPESSAYDVIDVHERVAEIDGWIPILGEAPVGPMPFLEDELSPPGVLEDEPLDEDRVSEATGNEGASFERSYRRAVMVLWRRDRRIAMTAQGGWSQAAPILKRLLRGARQGGDAPVEALELASHLVDGWESGDRGAMLAMLERIGDAGLLERFITEVVAVHYNGSENEALSSASLMLSAERCGELFPAMVGAQIKRHPLPCAELVGALVAAWMEIDGGRPLCARLAEVLAARIEDASPAVWWSRGADHRSFLAAALTAIASAGDPVLSLAAVSTVLGAPQRYPADGALIEAALEIDRAGDPLANGTPWFGALWRACVEHLLARSAEVPVRPPTWARDASYVSCRCADCAELARFLRDPAQESARFKRAQAARHHVAGSASRADVSQTTDRSGSTHTLVLSKNTRSYDERCMQRTKDLAALQRLGKMSMPEELAALAERARSLT